MPVSEATFEAVVLEDGDGTWELHCGRLREKPPMSFGHNWSARELAYQLSTQLPRSDFDVFQNGGHLRAPTGETYVPDIAVVPVAFMAKFGDRPASFEVYDEAMPFLSEFWSPKTGTYEIETKFPAYRLRGNAEIWRVHPFQRTVTMWRRQPDGSYSETVLHGGVVELHALPWVRIDVDNLFLPQ
jgi:Uma2 family endonuclease